MAETAARKYLLRERLPLAVVEFREPQRELYDVVGGAEVHHPVHAGVVLQVLEPGPDAVGGVAARLDGGGEQANGIVEVWPVEVGVLAVALVVAGGEVLHGGCALVPAGGAADEASGGGAGDVGEGLVLDRAVADELGLHADLGGLANDQARLGVVRV